MHAQIAIAADVCAGQHVSAGGLQIRRPAGAVQQPGRLSPAAARRHSSAEQRQQPPSIVAGKVCIREDHLIVTARRGLPLRPGARRQSLTSRRLRRGKLLRVFSASSRSRPVRTGHNRTDRHAASSEVHAGPVAGQRLFPLVVAGPGFEPGQAEPTVLQGACRAAMDDRSPAGTSLLGWLTSRSTTPQPRASTTRRPRPDVTGLTGTDCSSLPAA